MLKGLFGEPEVTSFTLDESIGTWKLKNISINANDDVCKLFQAIKDIR